MPTNQLGTSIKSTTYPWEASMTRWKLEILVAKIWGSLEFPASVITTDFFSSVQQK